MAPPVSPEPKESRTADRLPLGPKASTETSLLRRSRHTFARFDRNEHHDHAVVRSRHPRWKCGTAQVAELAAAKLNRPERLSLAGIATDVARPQALTRVAPILRRAMTTHADSTNGRFTGSGPGGVRRIGSRGRLPPTEPSGRPSRPSRPVHARGPWIITMSCSE